MICWVNRRMGHQLHPCGSAKLVFSQVRSELTAEWKRLVYDTTGTRLGHLSHHGVSPLLPKPRPANHAERTPAEQPREQWGAAKPAICIYTRMQHTNTHARDFHKCGGGDWQTKSQEKGHKPRHTHTTNTRFVLKSGVEFWCLLSSANKRSPHAVTLSLWHSHSLISHNQTWIIMQPRVRATHCLAAFLKSIRPLSSPLLIYTTACTRVCVCVCERETQPSACCSELWQLNYSLLRQ